MNIHREIYIRSRLMSDEAFITMFKEFALATSEWEFMESQSLDYTTRHGSPSCLILYTSHRDKPAIALTSKKPGAFYVPNIVPGGECSQLSMEQYNRIAQLFGIDLRTYVAKRYKHVKIHITGDTADLSQIIPGPALRRYFESYLQNYPKTFHPSDLRRLDLFTCALYRSPHAKAKPYLIERYLIENLNWTTEEARACVQRIEIGLDVLKTYRGK